MRRVLRSLAIAVVLIALAWVAWQFLGRLFVQPPGISAAALTPAPTPADARTLGVIRLKVTSNAAGDVATIVMSDGLVQLGYGPNVLNRPGAWTVSLSSSADEVLRFGISDPRQVHVEGATGEEAHTGSFLAEVEFELIVPLSDALGNDLAITALRLFDQPGNLIFAAVVRGGKIAPVPVRQLPVEAAG